MTEKKPHSFQTLVKWLRHSPEVCALNPLKKEIKLLLYKMEHQELLGAAQSSQDLGHPSKAQQIQG